MNLRIKSFYFLAVFFVLITSSTAQVTKRERPKEWNNLIEGGRFMDLFLPIPVMDSLTRQTWGADNVLPRYVDNGIEDNEYSYWGGNTVLGNDEKYHLFVCRWREDSPKGHMEWPHSEVVHAISENPIGPYKVVGTVGSGHNPELFQLKDGSYIVYIIDGYYRSDSLNGPWQYAKFDFEPRDRPIIEGLSNLSFTPREDGSYLMVCRGGGIWFSKDGTSAYHQVTDKSVYPPVEGRFEDPVVWRDHVQYHMIVNDWHGRIAFYLRSKDGVQWKVDPGEAYLPAITLYEDGTNEDWFKYERIKILQDELGRAVQANFAVIDTLKHEDKPRDGHNSKNIGIPLTVGKQIVLLNKKRISEKTKLVTIKVKAEKDFDPHQELDINSLRFGAPEEVNFGKGCKVKDYKKDGTDLIINFYGEGNGFRDHNFTGKLLGKTREGTLLFGYAQLPWVNYKDAILSARLPEITIGEDGSEINVIVENFGQRASDLAKITISVSENDTSVIIASGIVPELKSFEQKTIPLSSQTKFEKDKELRVTVTIYIKGKTPIPLSGKITAH